MQKLKLLLFSLKAISLWLSVFISCRILFLIFNNQALSFAQVIPALYKGFFLDISTACYLILLPVLIFVWNEIQPVQVKQKILHLYFILAISLVIIVEILSLFLFPEWGSTLNYRAFRYLLYPNEAAASVEWKLIISVATISVVMILFWNYLFRKTLFLHQNNFEKKWTGVFAVIIIPFLMIGMRGGLGQISISESSAYFSENNFLNQAALNKTWYFIRNVLNNVQKKKPFYYFPEFIQPQLFSKLYTKGESKKWLNTNKPNIVLVILEGWNADIIGSLGGIKGLTPCFDSLAETGLLFTNMYGSGTRTDQGVVSILSGFPAMPDLSIIQEVEKSVKLPSLIKDLKNVGYFTTFIYGGEPEFCNFQTYFVAQGTEKMIDKYDYPKSQRAITWGVPDHLLLEKVSSELQTVKEPFFAITLTLSSHQPFDSPFKSTPETFDNAGKYKASTTYMDAAISKFVKKCSKEKWYNNTLFIFVADHGNTLPLKRDYNDHERFHIPVLFHGNVLDSTMRGEKISTFANHHDLPATLLSQLGMSYQSYRFSKDISADSVSSFAYWSTDNTMGWLTENQKIGINLHNAEVFSWIKQPVKEEQQNGIGYVQEILKEYEKY